MEFFDSLINEVNSLIENNSKSVHRFCDKEQWTDLGYSQVVLQRDMAFELNGTGFSLVTTSAVGDEIVIVGKDLCDIHSSCNFARVAVVEIDDTEDEQTAYNLIKKIEFIKYHCFPDGFMMRSASSSFKESVRISKSALKKGLDFYKIGNLFLSKYKEIPQVKGVKIIFITDASADYSAIKSLAEKNRTITETLNRVMNDMTFDCSSCNLKPICDEVEGMRELHFKSAQK